MALYIRKDNDEMRDVTAIYKGNKVVSAVYLGLKLLWGYIKSCYGRAYWIDEKMWSNTDAWGN